MVYAARLFFIFLLWIPGGLFPVQRVLSRELSYPELATGADLPRTFNRSHTYIAIPTADYVYTYAPPKETSDVWRLIDSALIPRGTIGIDGNIRKLHFLLEDRIIYQEYSVYDTLTFDDKFIRIDPRLWVRTPYSTERDVYFMENGMQIAYYSDGEDWFISDSMNPRLFRVNKTTPLLDEQEPFKKLYSFHLNDAWYIAAVHRDRVSFHWYETVHDSLNIQAEKPAQLTFELPQDALSVFVYDRCYLGVVFSNTILFYQFNTEEGQWEPNSRIKPFMLTGATANK